MMSDDSNNQSLARLTIDQSTVPAAIDPIENAIVLWAEASTRAETRDREERLRDKKHIIRSFLKYVGKHPGEVDLADVQAWRKHLESAESQKSGNTVYSYLSRVHPSQTSLPLAADFERAQKDAEPQDIVLSISTCSWRTEIAADIVVSMPDLAYRVILKK